MALNKLVTKMAPFTVLAPLGLAVVGGGGGAVVVGVSGGSVVVGVSGGSVVVGCGGSVVVDGCGDSVGASSPKYIVNDLTTTKTANNYVPSINDSQSLISGGHWATAALSTAQTMRPTCSDQKHTYISNQHQKLANNYLTRKKLESSERTRIHLQLVAIPA